MNKIIKLLFVCHGNICRSPIACSLFEDIVYRNKIGEKFEFDSAATSREEIGNGIYPPMLKIARENNLPSLDHRARQLTESDIKDSDYIFIMDNNNKRNILRLYPGAESKLRLLTEYTNNAVEIEDPWYTGNYLFVYKQIKDCIEKIFKFLMK